MVLKISALAIGWRRLIGCLKSQVIFRKRATNYRALLRKWHIKIRHPMTLRHPVYLIYQSHGEFIGVRNGEHILERESMYSRPLPLLPLPAEILQKNVKSLYRNVGRRTDYWEIRTAVLISQKSAPCLICMWVHRAERWVDVWEFMKIMTIIIVVPGWFLGFAMQCSQIYFRGGHLEYSWRTDRRSHESW